MVQEIDYYRVLGLHRTATEVDIKNAFRRLSLKYHPKRSEDPMAQEKFGWICEAYDVFSQKRWKAVYDQYGCEGLKKGIPVKIGDQEVFGRYTFHGDCEKIFRDFFGVDNPYAEIFVPNTPAPDQLEPPGKQCQGRSAQIELPLTLEEMYHGCTKQVDMARKVLNADGRTTHPKTETFTLQIKPGCPVDRLFIFPQQADQGPGMVPGDVVLMVKTKPHCRFSRDGNNLVYSTNVHLVHALTGLVLDILTLDDRMLHFPITDIVTPGFKKVVPGEGMPLEDNPKLRGDLIIEFTVIFPKALSPKQKDLIRKALPLPTPPPTSPYHKQGLPNPCENCF